MDHLSSLLRNFTQLAVFCVLPASVLVFACGKNKEKKKGALAPKKDKPAIKPGAPKDQKDAPKKDKSQVKKVEDPKKSAKDAKKSSKKDSVKSGPKKEPSKKSEKQKSAKKDISIKKQISDKKIPSKKDEPEPKPEGSKLADVDEVQADPKVEIKSGSKKDGSKKNESKRDGSKKSGSKRDDSKKAGSNKDGSKQAAGSKQMDAGEPDKETPKSGQVDVQKTQMTAMPDVPKELAVDPKELQFASSGGLIKLNLANNTGNRLAVKIKCSDNDLYRLNPVFCIVEKDGHGTVDVTRINGTAKPDKLAIVYTEATNDATDAQLVFKAGLPAENLTTLNVPMFVN